MENKPLVTICIPVYNKASSVARTILSVQTQTLSNFECIIVNDGSTDDSEKVIREAISNDPRFTYIYQDNHGVAIARNTGVFSGSAPYVCCLDADDALDPRFLEVCVMYLQNDPMTSIAYTGLWAIQPDGKEGLSPWPGEFNFDEALKGHNQIPTCNVARRYVWERLGGQRQRYAPDGAGEEDAELWLRAGAYGYSARKVTEAGLFIYSWMTGQVSGNRQHKMTNYTIWHPWVQDGKHPFASLATPKKFSHPVRQYDQPTISVIIPVGPKHVKDVINALDSLEAQTFRNWEAIVVDDTMPTGATVQSDELHNMLRKSYPFVRETWAENRGAGAARNQGASIARAPLLLFLDADDWLTPDALDEMLFAWETEQSIAYSDYVAKAYIDGEKIDQFRDKILEYYPDTGMAAITNEASDYACERAVAQPTRDLYIWCLVTSLVPKAWHDEIGGFDEKMPSWEDWDYWIRMAKAGKCFIHIPKPLVVYRFYSGSRRLDGLQEGSSLIQYLKEKYKDEEMSPCNCPGKTKTQTPLPPPVSAYATRAATVSFRSNGDAMMPQDENLVLCLYDHPNRGQHRVVGPITHRDYGYRGGGSKFLVDKRDVASMPHIFKPIQEDRPKPYVPKVAPKETVPPKPIVEQSVQSAGQSVTVSVPAPPKVITTPDIERPQESDTPVRIFTEGAKDITDLPAGERPLDLAKDVAGITPVVAQQLEAAGVHTAQDLLDFGKGNLMKVKGIAERRAEAILEFARQIVEGT